jgi:predicted CXXCH cytochrome family protein
VQHPPVQTGQCLECHQPHASRINWLLKMDINNTCRECHESVFEQPHGAVTRLGSSQGHPLSAKRDIRRRGREHSCTSCHDPHSSDWTRLFRYEANQPLEICKHCHRDKVN